jgi:hypothetical protein
MQNSKNKFDEINIENGSSCNYCQAPFYSKKQEVKHCTAFCRDAEKQEQNG